MQDQPTVNGSEPTAPKITPSAKAYMDAANKLVQVSRIQIIRDLSRGDPDNEPPAELADLCAYLMASIRMREADNYAMLSILESLKLATLPEFQDRSAAHAEKYASQLMDAMRKALARRPAIMLPRGHG